MRGPIAFILAAVFLSGCKNTTDDLAEIGAPAPLSPGAYNAIAGDLVSQLVEQLGPGRGTIVLESGKAGFGQALSTALASWDYAVATAQKTDDRQKHIQLTYMIDDFGGQTLARLSTGDLELARAYTVTATGASSTSATSIMRRL